MNATQFSPSAVSATLTFSQQATFDRLYTAWQKRGVKLENLSRTMNGLDLMIDAGQEWPTIKIGPRGGIQILQLRSYPEDSQSTAFDAAVRADVLYARQLEREKRKLLQAIKKPVVSVPVPTDAVQHVA